jgi:hypothetical protein
MDLKDLTQHEALLILDSLGKYKQQVEYIMSNKQLPQGNREVYNDLVNKLESLIPKVEDQIKHQIVISEVKQYMNLINLSKRI